MRWLALAIMLAASDPASAACHKFSIWHYPHPQRCWVVAQLQPEPPPPPPPKLKFEPPAIFADIHLTDADPARMQLRLKLREVHDGNAH